MFQVKVLNINVNYFICGKLVILRRNITGRKHQKEHKNNHLHLNLQVFETEAEALLRIDEGVS